MKILDQNIYSRINYASVDVDMEDKDERVITVSVASSHNLETNDVQINSIDVMGDSDQPISEEEEKEIIEFVRNNIN